MPAPDQHPLQAELGSFWPILDAATDHMFVAQLQQAVGDHLAHHQHGDLPRWQAALDALPAISEPAPLLDGPAVGVAGTTTKSEHLHTALQGLIPWRKGPFQFADVLVDAEWRSDLKWDRLQQSGTEAGAAQTLNWSNQLVLDVGGGNGYYALRALGLGAGAPRCVIVADPSALFACQMNAVRRYCPDLPAAVLPLTSTSTAAAVGGSSGQPGPFDTVLSMGVLYHRRSPIDHLMELASLVNRGGTVILETLIHPEDNCVLVPPGRYAGMRNVWFLPGVDQLTGWLHRCGLEQVSVVNRAYTTAQEQRATTWMPFHSLAAALHAEQDHRTIEDLPGPLRAILVAQRR